MNYHSPYMAEGKKDMFFYTTVVGVMEMNCSHETPSDMVPLTAFTAQSAE